MAGGQGGMGMHLRKGGERGQGFGGTDRWKGAEKKGSGRKTPLLYKREVKGLEGKGRGGCT